MSLIVSDDLPAGKTAEEEGANSLGPVLVHPGAEGLMEPPGAGVEPLEEHFISTTTI